MASLLTAIPHQYDGRLGRDARPAADDSDELNRRFEEVVPESPSDD
jgi:hypothetical protein